ncbi:Thioredoxin-like fold domain-containing protein [Sphingomonas antarctica]|uniref:thioredoxin domain-containing protein n=1 Tax=Sphingomonas antarctica TaxID=2040274 RepID=UPI0039ED0A5C
MKKTAALMAILALAACKKEETNTTVAASAPVAGATAPAGQDWTTTFASSPEGGFIMGNPNAPIKLVEYGSLTCPHCAEFSEKGTAPLKALVQQGKLSWEFRNYVRDAVDTTATLIARCNGPASYFGMLEAMYAAQASWFAKIQAVPQAQLESIQNLPPAQQFPKLAELTGLKDFAAQRGVGAAKADACLADQTQAQQLAKMVETANKMDGFVGTPTFLINGQIVPNSANWETLEPALKQAGA